MEKSGITVQDTPERETNGRTTDYQSSSSGTHPPWPSLAPPTVQLLLRGAAILGGNVVPCGNVVEPVRLVRIQTHICFR
jgi:hypothetical protein